MHRFYTAEEIDKDTVSIADTEQLHHLRDVLRLRVRDEVAVFDTAGNEYACIITGLTRKEAVLAIKARKRAQKEKVKITVACALPKNARMDEIVDSLTQLGVASIIPMETERVIIRLDGRKKEARLRRWRRIALSAARQSQRNRLPQVEPVMDMASVVARSPDFDLRLITTLCGARKPLKAVLAGSEPGRILVLIGPEGDFTADEVALAEKAGFIPVSLGDTVLRVATAAVAVVSYLRLALPDAPR